jgi:hypothetical protein
MTKQQISPIRYAQPPHRFKRVLRMSLAEISERARQRCFRQLDYFSWFHPDFSGLTLSGELAFFFFSPAEISERVTSLKAEFPGDVDRIIKIADDACLNRFSLLGFEALDYGPEVDWQLDAVSRKRAPFLPWQQIEFLDYASVGDVKVTWELNRHQFLVTLARAFCLTNNQRYLSTIQYLWYDWQNKNPYPLGVNWASSLEVAFRSLSWMWVIALLSPVESTITFRQDIVRALAFNGWYLRRYLSLYFSPNTHLLGEAVGLFFIGTTCPELASSQEWQRLGYKLIAEHARTKVLADGGYYELSTYYHVYALDFFLHARILADRSGLEDARELDATIRPMLDYLAALSQGGPPPRLGDDDGGRVFDSQRNRSEHMSDPLSIGARYYADWTHRRFPQTEEALWLLGSERSSSAIENSASAVKHTALTNSGLYVFGFGDQQLTIDTGSLGGENGGHGHADGLAISFSQRGKQILIDPGTYRYIGPDNSRNEFRSTRAHNTITVDGVLQALPTSAFGWCTSPSIVVKTFEQSSDFCLLTAELSFDCVESVIHTRTLFGLQGKLWLVLDKVEAAREIRAEQRWHFDPSCSVSQEVGGFVGLASGSSLWMTSAGLEGVQTLADFSGVYGRSQLTPSLSFSSEGMSPLFFATLIVPDVGKRTGLRWMQKQDTLQLESDDQRSLFVMGQNVWSCKGVMSDADFAYLHFDQNEVLESFVVIRATSLSFLGRELFRSATPQSQFNNTGSHLAGAAR